MEGEHIKNTVNLISTITVKAGQEVQVKAKLRGKGDSNGMVCVLDPSRTLFARTGALVPRICVKPKQESCTIRVLNASEQHIKLRKNMTMGVLQPAYQVKPFSKLPPTMVHKTEDIVDSDSDVMPETLPTTPKENKKIYEIPEHVLQDKEATKRYLKDLRREARDVRRRVEDVNREGDLPEHVIDLYERSIREVPEKYHRKIRDVIAKHAQVFAKSSTDMGRTNWVKHDIETGEHSPVRQRARRLRHDQRDEIQKQIKALQENGLIRPSKSECGLGKEKRRHMADVH